MGGFSIFSVCAMTKVNIRMLQKSILCGFKGTVNFAIAAVVAANGATIRAAVPGGGSGPRKRYEGLYGMYNNVVPTVETLLCMGVLCTVLERVAFKNAIQDTTTRILVSMLICMVLMMMICTLLRVFDKRKDCCADYDYEESYGRVGGYGPHFAVPSGTRERNMLSALAPGKLSKRFAFDRHVPEPPNDGYPIRTHREKALHFLGAVAALPLWLLMLALNCVELPFVLLLDCVALCTKAGRARPLGGTRDVAAQMLYGIYNVCEPVTCLLPHRAQMAVGAAFEKVSHAILPSRRAGGGSGGTEPGSEVNEVRVSGAEQGAGESPVLV
ncbi:hypothetical protein AS219_03200 [Neorickettsia sp. 179522]|nr:hypothetical protein AS219_03200 [Neorickettsia sp. 179522]